MLRTPIIALLILLAVPALAGPPARLADLAWLEGTWEGQGIGGAPSLEVYSAAAGGAMPGHFRQMKGDGSVMFYELITIVEKAGSLVYRLKHFNADLTGWEAQAEVREFPLTAVGPDRWTFEGLEYERTGPDTLTVRVESKGDDGKPEQLSFSLRRTAR